jgi:hypothetical protein
MDEHLAYIEELSNILDSGVRFTINRVDNKFVIALGDPNEPVATAVTNDLGQAVSWLREQVKSHYPHCAYSRRLLIN